MRQDDVAVSIMRFLNQYHSQLGTGECLRADLVRQCILLLCEGCTKCLDLSAPCEGKCLSDVDVEGGLDIFTTHVIGGAKTRFMGRFLKLDGQAVFAHVTSQKEVDSYVTVSEIVDKLTSGAF